MMTDKWVRRFLGLAEYVSAWSKDPGTKVGAVIADDRNRIVSIGYNGFPVGVTDEPSRLADRGLKLSLTVHAETNAILFARRALDGCRLFTWPFQPCSRCAGLIVQAGIKECFTLVSSEARWAEDFAIAAAMLAEGGVTLTQLPSDAETTNHVPRTDDDPGSGGWNEGSNLHHYGGG